MTQINTQNNGIIEKIDKSKDGQVDTIELINFFANSENKNEFIESISQDKRFKESMKLVVLDTIQSFNKGKIILNDTEKNVVFGLAKLYDLEINLQTVGLNDLLKSYNTQNALNFFKQPNVGEILATSNDKMLLTDYVNKFLQKKLGAVNELTNLIDGIMLSKTKGNDMFLLHGEKIKIIGYIDQISQDLSFVKNLINSAKAYEIDVFKGFEELSDKYSQKLEDMRFGKKGLNEIDYKYLRKPLTHQQAGVDPDLVKTNEQLGYDPSTHYLESIEGNSIVLPMSEDQSKQTKIKREKALSRQQTRQSDINISNKNLIDGLDSFRNRIKSLNSEQLLTELKTQHLNLSMDGLSSFDQMRIKDLTVSLNRLIYDQLISLNANNSQLLSFVRLITGRDSITGQDSGILDSKKVDTRFQDSETANVVLVKAMQLSGSWNNIIKDVNLIDSNDKNIDLNPKKIIEEFFASKHVILEFMGTGMKLSDKGVRRMIFARLGMDSVLNYSDKTKVDNLDVNNTVFLLLLQNFTQISKQNKLNSMEEIFRLAGQQAQLKGKQMLENGLSKSLGKGLFAKDVGLKGEDKQLYDLWSDINGLGILDFKDSTNHQIKDYAKIAGVLVASIVGAVVTAGIASPLGVVAAGALAGGSAALAGSVADSYIFDKGYDSNEEKTQDVLSSVCLGLITGVLGGAGSAAIASKFSSTSFTNNLYKQISKQFPNSNMEPAVINQQLSRAVGIGLQSGKKGEELLSIINTNLTGIQLNASMLRSALDNMPSQLVNAAVSQGVSTIDFGVGLSTEYIRQTNLLKQDVKFIDMIKQGGIMYVIGLVTGNISLMKKHENFASTNSANKEHNLNHALDMLNSSFISELELKYAKGELKNASGESITLDEFNQITSNLSTLKEGIQSQVNIGNLALQDKINKLRLLTKNPKELLKELNLLTKSEIALLCENSGLEFTSIIKNFSKNSDDVLYVNGVYELLGKMPQFSFEQLLNADVDNILMIFNKLSDSQIIDFKNSQKEKFLQFVNNLSNDQVKQLLDQHPSLNKLVYIEQIEYNIDHIIDKHLADNPNLSELEKQAIIKDIRDKAKLLVNNIAQNEMISSKIVNFVAGSKGLLYEKLNGMNIKSVNHILESLIQSVNIPNSDKVQKLLNEIGGNMSQNDFFAVVTVFHDLCKSYLPAQFVGDIHKLLSGNNLTSHQKDSADLVRKLGHIDLTQNEGFAKDCFVKMLDQFNVPGKDPQRLQNILNKFADIIEGHAGNTEFMQIDAARGGNNLLKKVDQIFSSSEYSDLKTVQERIDYLKDLGITSKSDNSQRVWLFQGADDIYSKVVFNGPNFASLSEFDEFVKKLFLQKYLKNNLGKDLELSQIDLNEFQSMFNGLESLNKSDQLKSILSSSSESNIQNHIVELIDQKLSTLKPIEETINQYLNTRQSSSPDLEEARFIFNLHDISGYLNPSAESFIKLIGLDKIELLMASPLNSSLATLSELKLKISKLNPSDPSYQSYESMYKKGLENVIKLVQEYQNYAKKPYVPYSIDEGILNGLQTDLAGILKGEGINNFGEFYDKITAAQNWSRLPTGLQQILKQYLINSFRSLCEMSSENMQNIY